MEFRSCLSLQTSTSRLMKGSIISAIVFFSINVNAQQPFQLAPPLLKFRSVFFTDTAMLQMDFKQSAAEIHYTTTGMEPSEADPIYKKPLVIKNKLTTVKARTFSKDFLPS